MPTAPEMLEPGHGASAAARRPPFSAEPTDLVKAITRSPPPPPPPSAGLRGRENQQQHPQMSREQGEACLHGLTERGKPHAEVAYVQWGRFLRNELTIYIHILLGLSPRELYRPSDRRLSAKLMPTIC
jgi:hypothetical protein